MRLPAVLSRPVFWTWAAAFLGLGLRTFYYLRDFPAWHDEAALVVNILFKGFADQLGPLLVTQAAPPGFLWLERAAYLACGDSLQTLRFPTFLAGCLSLVMFVWLARRWLPETAAPWAVLLFSVSDRLLWHSCEVKPYAFDVLAATGMLFYAAATCDWPVARRLAGCAVLTPILVWTTYPGCFLCGGLLVSMLPAVLRERRWTTWLGYTAVVSLTGAVFLLMALGPIRAQRCPDLVSCWTGHFPDYQRPAGVPWWVVSSTLNVFHYACNPNGEYLACLGLLGAVVWWKQGQRLRVVLLTVPVGLCLAAALLHAYPYGGSRLLVYATPAVILLIGCGFHAACDWLRPRHAFGGVLLSLLLVVPAANTARRLVVPWEERADVAGAAEFVFREHTPGDQIVANSWQALYYLRNPPATCNFLTAGSADPVRPLWVIATDRSPDIRRTVAAAAAAGRSEWERHEFAGTTVWRFSPASQKGVRTLFRREKGS
jgi:hypothetical protein